MSRTPFAQSDPSKSGRSQSDLSKADLSEADLPEADLPEAALPKSVLSQSALSQSGAFEMAAADRPTIANAAIAENRYDQEQWGYWQQLQAELESYKTDLGATNTELAECLGISRQPLVQFMQDARCGLPIQRINLVRLVDGLTDPARFRKKHGEAVRSRRQKLRHIGPDRLLKAAGFLPNAEPVEIQPHRYQQIQRLVTRLSHLPVKDFADFITLTEFLETFVTNSFPDRHKVSLDPMQIADLAAEAKSNCKYEAKSESKSESKLEAKKEAKSVLEPVRDRVDYWVEKNNLPYPPSHAVKAKLQGALSRLAISGKSELNNVEFFELYMAIAENERFGSHVDESLQMRITQCQFTTLTLSLHTYLSAEHGFIAAAIDRASLQAEQLLRPKLRADDDLQDAVQDSVIEASITCNFRAEDQDVRWRYSSSTTHFENMLAAIERGMGYAASLEMVDFSIRTLGHKDYSLIRASTAFRPVESQPARGDYKTYQSVWVDRSAILSILQSTAIAVRTWLTENFPDAQSCRHYYEVCRTVAELDEILVNSKKLLNGYRIQQTELHHSWNTTEYLEKNIIEPITALKTGLLQHYPRLAECFGADLDQKYCVAKLACAHSAVIAGNMALASRLLAEVGTFLDTFAGENHPLRVSYDMEKKLQQFFQGNAAIFGPAAQWRSQLQTSLEQLSRYIHETRQDCGRFDSDIYITASEVLGRLGRLNFACCAAQEVDELENAVQQFLMAAYCSAKIGHPQRAAHWISNASRTCCRLGAGDRAAAFAKLAHSMIDRAIQPPFSTDYQEAILAEVNIAQGERLLLVEKNAVGALDYFLRSLKGSIYIGFVRLIADNLYNIFRAAQDLGNYRVRKSFASAFVPPGRDLAANSAANSAASAQTWTFDEAHQGWQENKIAAEVIQFLNALDKDSDWSSVAVQFKLQSQKIWQGWANAGDPQGQERHPLAVAMDEDQG